MRIDTTQIPGSALPVVVVVSVVILTAMAGLLVLWEHEMLLFARSCRLRQARADVESVYTLYRLYPRFEELTDPAGFQLHDSLPGSRVLMTVEPWGLYEAVGVCTADSIVRTCRLFGTHTDAARTLFYADGRSAVTLAGETRLRGQLRLPRNGLVYGRVGADFYRGKEIARLAIGLSEQTLPAPQATALSAVSKLFAGCNIPLSTQLPDSLVHPFRQDSVRCIRLGNAQISDCVLRGKVILYADELRIDSTCRLSHLIVCARKITVGHGTHITSQLFARDTVIIESRAVLGYLSGIYAGVYAEVGDHVRIDGYAIVRDTVRRSKVSANYRQARTARLRGLLYVDGIAQVQGIVSGQVVVRQTAYFSPQGYYKDMIYDLTLLENPVTARPLWLAALQRKEAVCVD